MDTTETTLLTDTQIKQQIATLHFDPICKKLQLVCGWAPRHTKVLAEQYRNFLFLMKKYHGKGIFLVPSDEIDEFWHQHILDTQKYAEDCERLFGKFIHHQPGAPWEAFDGDSTINYAQCFDQTQELYKKEFGDYIYMVRPLSPRRFLRNLLLRIRLLRIKFRMHWLLLSPT